MTLPVIALVGSTASGKSDLALDLAQALAAQRGLGAEIVNADAMQLYRGMDIGTAKLSPAERRGLPHHEIDVLDVTQEASVAAYQQAARCDVEAIRGRGNVPILVGGSGLYVRAVLDVIDFPGTNPAIRAELQGRAEREGTAALFEDLAAKDPAAAARIEDADLRRIIRALEVIEMTGEPYSASLPSYAYAMEGVRQFGLSLPYELLDERIFRRVGEMLKHGLVDEVRALEGQGLRQGKTASRAIGYAQTLEYFDGMLAREELQGRIALKTRQLARYQRKWFAKDPRVTWLAPEGAVQAIVESALPA